MDRSAPFFLITSILNILYLLSLFVSIGFVSCFDYFQYQNCVSNLWQLLVYFSIALLQHCSDISMIYSSFFLKQQLLCLYMIFKFIYRVCQKSQSALIFGVGKK